MEMEHFARVNLTRCLRWHPEGLNSWSLSDWAVALAGETGELCNVVKKLNRIRDQLAGNKAGVDEAGLRAALADEIGDVFAYLDLVAQAAGLSLEHCARDKFNRVSERLNMPERL
jgi:NTP pyrophosphatase (non-canonical NTP hydrolase)